MLSKSTPKKPEPHTTPWWKKLLRYLTYTVASVLLGAAAWGLLWYWPQQAGKDLGVKPGSQDIEVLEKVQQLEKDRVATGAQVFLGLGILVGIYFTWRRIRATERQAQTAQDQMELARRQQTAERFTQAIKQLGNGEISIRLGGIFALEKIAQDEPEAYFSLFREVLSAFVRESARTSRGADEDGHLIPPPTDLQATLTVLGRYPPPEVVEDPARIDWSGAHLDGANLEEARLECANLSYAHLQGAYLGGAHLEYGFLAGVNLEGAYLVDAHLEDAFLQDARLKGADLGGAHLQRADLRGADLEDTDLSGANLEGADFGGVRKLDRAFYDRHTRFPEGVKAGICKF